MVVYKALEVGAEAVGMDAGAEGRIIGRNFWGRGSKFLESGGKRTYSKM